MRRRSLRRVAVLSLHLVTTRGLKDVTGGVEVSFQLAYDLREFCSAMHACNYNFLSCLVNSSQYSAWLHFSLAPTQPWMRAQSPSALPISGRDTMASSQDGASAFAITGRHLWLRSKSSGCGCLPKVWTWAWDQLCAMWCQSQTQQGAFSEWLSSLPWHGFENIGACVDFCVLA